MQFFYSHISGLVSSLSGVDAGAIEESLCTPPDTAYGDISLPCFALARALNKPPVQLARALAEQLSAEQLARLDSPLVESLEARGPYLNFRLNRPRAAALLLGQAAQPHWGSSQTGQGRTVVIDFSSPNIAKPMHLGHLRSTVIGNSLKRIYEFQGWLAVGINHLGDWGTQFGKLMVAYHRWGDQGALMKSPIDELLRLYQLFGRMAEEEPSLEDEARAAFRRLEEGEPETRNLWQFIVDASLNEISRIYRLMGVEFDACTGESFYEDKMKDVVDELAAKNLLVESDGALVVRLDDEGLPPCLIVKSDGATIYATRDLAAALYRRRHYEVDRILYVVDQGQSIHFAQVFAVLKRAGHAWAEECEHVGFGVLRVDGKRLRTRAGDFIYLEELLDRAVAVAHEIISEKSPGLMNKDEVARAVGTGAVVFNDLKRNRVSDVDFSWDEALSFDGQTGPYVQYAHARASKILRDAGLAPDGTVMAAPCDAAAGVTDDAGLKTAAAKTPSAAGLVVAAQPEEWAVVSELAAFPQAVRRAEERMEPSVVAQYLLSLAQAFNRFYHDKSILKAGVADRAARLSLVMATKNTLKTGLWLLGIEAPDSM